MFFGQLNFVRIYRNIQTEFPNYRVAMRKIFL